MLASLFIFYFVTAISAKPPKLKEISIPALGRPFSLGDLYDRRRDYMIEGPKLWSHEELGIYDEERGFGTEFLVTASQSINEDMSHFDLSASLKLSFLSGLVSVAGSASYLDDRKKKHNQARVSLNYKSTTFKRSIRPKLFTKVTFPQVLEKSQDATDVVVAIRYGAGAIFTFDRDVMQNEVTKDVEGTLQIAIKKVPQVEVEGSGKVHISDEDRKKGEKLSCTFHGDFVLKTHPGTYEEAIRVYKTLPDLLGKNYENSVPVKVWLYPIENLPVERTAKIVYDIDESMITSVTNLVTDLEEVTRKCNDILDSPVSVHHRRIRVKVKMFHDYIKRYILLFKQKLAKIAPEIREGKLGTKELLKLLSKKESSPFSKAKLEEWIDYYKEEERVLMKIQSLPNYCKNDGEFSSKLLKEVRHTVGLTLKIGTMDEQYLKDLEKYLLTQQIESEKFALFRMPTKWWQPGGKILSDLFALSSSFRKCYDLRKSKNQLESSGIQFLVREEDLKYGEDKGITIELYEQGSIKDAKYQLITDPGIPTATSQTHDSISLTWEKPSSGFKNLEGYIVTTYTIKTSNDTKGCEGMYCKVGETIAMGSSVTVNGLKAQYPYYFTVSAFTDLGETSKSDMSDVSATANCFPGTYQVGKHECQTCRPGTFADKHGMTSCTTCRAGTYNPRYGAKDSNACILCPAGTFNPKKSSCSINDCLACPPGTYSTKTGAIWSHVCHNCPSGTFNYQAGAHNCVKCKTDSYNPDEGKSECVKCVLGRQSKTQGATSASQCVQCDAAAVADQKIDAVRNKVEKSFHDYQGEVDLNVQELLSLQKSKRIEAAELTNSSIKEGKALLRKVDTIHGCKWASGEGNARREFEMHNAYSRESCIYQCLKLKTSNSLINGVTRKLSNNRCKCLQQMEHISASSRYQTCTLA